MKRYFALPGLLAVLGALGSTLHPQEIPTELEANKRVARSCLEAWNSGATSRLGEWIAEHGRWWIGGKSYPWGPKAEASVMKGWLAAFPDSRITIDDVIAEGDRVAIRSTWTGTHTGTLEGIPPTGRTVRFSETLIYRFENGKMIENWVDWDELGMYRQLGVSPAGSPSPFSSGTPLAAPRPKGAGPS